MDAAERVVITGMGTINACTAGGTPAVAGALASGRSGIGPVRGFAIERAPSRLAAQVDDGALATLIDRDEGRRLSRICQLAVAAATLAVRDAGLTAATELGIVVGTEHGDFRSSREFAMGFLQRGPSGLSPMIFPNTVMNTMAAVAAIAVGARASSVTLNQATVAGELAIARATALIRAGRADAVVAGGVDEICEVVYLGLAELGVLSPLGGHGAEGCRPYESTHNGPVVGEGATFLVLETLTSARARGATLLAELTDVAWGSVPARPHGLSLRRPDRGSPVCRLLGRQRETRTAFARCYGSGNGDPALDDSECAWLARDLDGRSPLPPISLAPLFGQHGGLGALRVGAAALDASHGMGPVLVHGIARGGCRTALVVAPVDRQEAA
jgi:3-oxoacyl-[acyl-carrier-protein] synthase II